MLLSLCLGWLFGILSFYIGVGDFPYQLAFGLINGLQVSLSLKRVHRAIVVGRPVAHLFPESQITNFSKNVEV